METGCLEIIVNRETNTLVKAMRIIAIVLTVCFCLLFFFTMNFLLLIPLAACGREDPAETAQERTRGL